MDLTLPAGAFTLNIRVAVILRIKDKIILEKSTEGYYFLVGGRIKAGESSIDAAKREIKEEVGTEIDNLAFRASLEQFFGKSDKKVHEICFVYSADLTDGIIIPPEFYLVSKDELDQTNILPKVLKQILFLPDTESPVHLTLHDLEAI